MVNQWNPLCQSSRLRIFPFIDCALQREARTAGSTESSMENGTPNEANRLGVEDPEMECKGRGLQLLEELLGRGRVEQLLHVRFGGPESIEVSVVKHANALHTVVAVSVVPVPEH
eukprot:scaffold1617_cov252-Pinguiococcus_pyrenoidosus.AAC.10